MHSLCPADGSQVRERRIQRLPDVDVAAPAHLSRGRLRVATIAQGLLPSTCTLPPAAANAAAKATLLSQQCCCQSSAASTDEGAGRRPNSVGHGRPLHLQERCTCAPSFELPPSARQSLLRTRSQHPPPAAACSCCAAQYPGGAPEWWYPPSPPPPPYAPPYV